MLPAGGSAAMEESIPQGLKPLSLRLQERPKAEALVYLEAKTEAWFYAEARASDLGQRAKTEALARL